MIFSRSQKKALPKTKKKWQIDSEEEPEPEKLLAPDCSVCERDVGIFCLDCNAYFCFGDFGVRHPLTGKEDSELSKHRCRLVVGARREDLESEGVGWLVGDECTIHQQEIERKAKKRRREQEQEEASKKYQAKIEAEKRLAQEAEAKAEADRKAALAKEEAVLGSLRPNGIDRDSAFFTLSPVLQAELRKLFQEGKVDPTQMDEAIWKSILQFNEATGLKMLEELAGGDMSRIRNVKAFFIGILKKYRKIGFGLVGREAIVD